MTVAINLEDAVKAPFGTVFTDQMAIRWFKDGAWGPASIEPHAPLQLSPAAHCLHYSSSCFEGLKAHRRADGVYTFRLKDHMNRLAQSAELMCLPVPDPEEAAEMIRENIRRCIEWVPESPGSLYIRPTLIGSLASIGAAAHPSTEACFYILLSPVGDYFKSGPKPLRILAEDRMRTAPDSGMIKTGGNYASALRHIIKAREEIGTQQVLFCPNGDVQETGAANFFLFNDEEIITKKKSPSFLHGITRDSLLTLGRDLGYKVTERDFTMTEMLDFLKTGEAALSGTAAVLSGIGTMIYMDEEIKIGDGGIGPNTTRLRQALLDVQAGRAEDTHGWLERV